MPAPRRAILSDISEFELSDKKKLIVGKNGRLCLPSKSAGLTTNFVQEESFVEPEATHQPQEEAPTLKTLVSNVEVVETEKVLVESVATDQNDKQLVLESEKPKQINRAGRFKKKESAGSV